MSSEPYTGHVCDVHTDADGNLAHVFIDVPSAQLPRKVLERFLAGVKVGVHGCVKVRARALEVALKGAGLPQVGARARITTIMLLHNDKHLEA